MSLVELIIGICLFAIAIIPMFGIIPTAYISIKKAEDYAAASCYAHQVIEFYRLNDPGITDDMRNHWPFVMNNTEYEIYLDLYPRDNPPSGAASSLVDVVVDVQWKKIPEEIVLYSRIFYGQK